MKQTWYKVDIIRSGPVSGRIKIGEKHNIKVYVKSMTVLEQYGDKMKCSEDLVVINLPRRQKRHTRTIQVGLNFFLNEWIMLLDSFYISGHAAFSSKHSQVSVSVNMSPECSHIVNGVGQSHAIGVYS